CIQSIEFPFTF
nr:immunoglobulin light chain junction region [Macaca mulatta]